MSFKISFIRVLGESAVHAKKVRPPMTKATYRKCLDAKQTVIPKTILLALNINLFKQEAQRNMNVYAIFFPIKESEEKAVGGTGEQSQQHV